MWLIRNWIEENVIRLISKSDVRNVTEIQQERDFGRWPFEDKDSDSWIISEWVL
jgi:hypothetical protein